MDVDQDRVPQRLVGLPAHVELRRRDPDALLPDRARARVVARHATAADVGVMALGHAPEGDLALPEDGLEDRDVRRVVVAAVGVVEDEDVALVRRCPRSARRGPHRVRRRGHQHRDVGRLRDQAQVAVEDRGHEVARLGEDRRAARAQHRLADLAADGVQPVADDRGQDRGRSGVPIAMASALHSVVVVLVAARGEARWQDDRRRRLLDDRRAGHDVAVDRAAARRRPGRLEDRRRSTPHGATSARAAGPPRPAPSPAAPACR